MYPRARLLCSQRQTAACVYVWAVTVTGAAKSYQIFFTSKPNTANSSPPMAACSTGAEQASSLRLLPSSGSLESRLAAVRLLPSHLTNLAGQASFHGVCCLMMVSSQGGRSGLLVPFKEL